MFNIVFVLLQILMNASLVTIHVTRIVLTTKEVISAYVMRVLYSWMTKQRVKVRWEI